MATRVKITRHDSPGESRFVFDTGSSLSVDVVLTTRAPETTDPARFGKPSLPAGSEVYDVGTNDPGYSAQALYDPSKGQLIISVDGPAGQSPREFVGKSVDECVSRAYEGGAFR
jgi:hypothetical protein